MAGTGEADSGVAKFARPPQQERSVHTYQRMMDAGNALLLDRNIDAISIKDISGRAGCSIGSFYYRFRTKEEFFAGLIDAMIRHREQSVQTVFESVPIEEMPAALARGAILTHRRYAGLLRSAIKKHLEDGESWLEISRMGRRIVIEYQRRLAAARGEPLSDKQKDRITFAFVWLYGLLAQSVMNLNAIYGMDADTERFEQEVSRTFSDLIAQAFEA